MVGGNERARKERKEKKEKEKRVNNQKTKTKRWSWFQNKNKATQWSKDHQRKQSEKGAKRRFFGNAVERADGQPDQQRRFGNFFHQSEVCASCATYIKPKRLHFQHFSVNSLKVFDSP